jgi:hypothetical protein
MRRRYDSKKDKRGSNQETLGQVIERMLNVYRLKGGMRQVNLINHWQEIVGPAIAAKTDDVELRGERLIIRMSSAAMKHELFYQRQDIANNVNRFLQEEVVKEVDLQDAKINR